MFMGRHYAYLAPSIKHFICMMQQITLAALKNVRKVGITTTEVKMLINEKPKAITSPAIKQAYADLLNTPSGSPERKAALRRYKSLRKDAA
jgi:hypothetical protein